MTRADFVTWAKASGIHSDAYSFDGGHPSEAFVLDTQGFGWVVFYSERGLETDRRWHVKEADALADLQERLSSAHGIRADD